MVTWQALLRLSLDPCHCKLRPLQFRLLDRGAHKMTCSSAYAVSAILFKSATVQSAAASGQYLATPFLAAPASPQAAFTTQLPSYPSPPVASPGTRFTAISSRPGFLDMLITGSRVYTTTLPAQFAPSGSVHIAPAASAPVVTAAWLHTDFDSSHRQLVGRTYWMLQVPATYTSSYSLPPGQGQQ